MRPNLSDLAPRYGTDKGPKQHGYTKLYDLLFSQWRDREIVFVEMGLQIGGPEHGKGERQATDAPSVRMWLEYFPKAQIVGIDYSDFGWLKADRFAFHQCDMDDRANIARAAAVVPQPHIVLEDASHASKHQQDAFLEFFPRLASGGIYIIEDLQWQPGVYEAKYTAPKTRDLFGKFLETGRFEHPDKGMEAEFNALTPEISGAFLFQKDFVKSRKDKLAVIHKR